MDAPEVTPIVKDTDVINTAAPTIPEVEQKDTVSYDTYLKVLGEAKTAKAKLQAIAEAEQKALEAKALEQGKFKELYEKAVAEQQAKEERLNKIQEELSEYKELLAADIPNDVKSEFDLKSLSVKQIEVLRKKFTPSIPNTLGSEGSKPPEPPIYNPKMSLAEIQELAITNPMAYEEYTKKMMKKN